jgi:trehalose 6-phosphate phosphatase
VLPDPRVLPDPIARIVPLAARSAILLDFDGSLAPIVDEPEGARPLPAARPVLARLAAAVDLVAIVSGRPVAFLREHVGVAGVSYVGQYGLERLEGGAVVVDPSARPFEAAVARIATAAGTELPGAFVERKGSIAVGLHWRTRPELGPSVEAWAARAAADAGLELAPGRMAVELRPPVAMDKGRVVEELAAGRPAAVFAGDDRGDLPAFDALDRMTGDGRLEVAVRVGVRSPEEPPEIVARADVHVAGPAALVDLLDRLETEISARPGRAAP